MLPGLQKGEAFKGRRGSHRRNGDFRVHLSLGTTLLRRFLWGMERTVLLVILSVPTEDPDRPHFWGRLGCS